MNPFEIEIEKLLESVEVIDSKELVKIKLISEFLKTISKMKNEDVISITGLDKSDLSRLKALNTKRFTVDRIITLLDTLGLSTTIEVKSKEAS